MGKGRNAVANEAAIHRFCFALLLPLLIYLFIDYPVYRYVCSGLVRSTTQYYAQKSCK